MDTIKHWTVDIHLTEHDAEGVVRTHAEARLRARDDMDLRGRGEARKHPDDPDVPEIGDELAASRALSALAHALLEAAADDIERATGEPVRRLDA
ncbi:MAG TPA: dsRBD fold-containing protein [Euzebyales bacterium]